MSLLSRHPTATLRGTEQLRSERMDEASLLAALRNGDEGAFVALVDAHGPAMRRVARTFVRSDAVADEVVQEAWLGALRGLDRFEGRAALKTWLFRIVANIARTQAGREARTLPFSALELEREAESPEPSLQPDRFQGPDGRFPGGWVSFPIPWSNEPEAALLSAETRRVIEDAIATLPPGQRVVITLRDVEGWDASEVCSVLELSETNQRVLLHRARTKVRGAIEEYTTKELA
jgi:RNA polymerase sigma-70 factor (ECF subfamily)